MDVFNKLKSTVSNLSSVLPGNPVTREYEVGRQIASAGPGLVWKVYQASKRSTKQEASVFVLDKKVLDKYPKPIRDCIIECLKKGISQLTRLRHPSILTVQHPLEESRDSIAFAAEPVFSSLANVLGNHENLSITPELKDFKLYDVEIKYGLFQIAEGLAFLHNDVKMLHRNISPESIIVNKNGAWKLAGFDFSVSASNVTDKMLVFPSLEMDNDLPPILYPNLDHLAPEYVLTANCSLASDMFSLGTLIYSIFNDGAPLYQCNGNVSSIKRNSEKLKHLSNLSMLPTEAVEHVKMMIHITPEIRPDSHQFSKLQLFNDVGVKTLQFLDSIYQLDNLQKSHFYKGLPQIIAQMPKRVTLQRVLPCLTKEFVNPEMIPFVLPNVLLIAEKSTNEEFRALILPELIPVFKLQEPIQILLIFMQKMELLLTKCNPDHIRNNILPMVYSSLEANAQQIQELCLNVIPSFASLIDYPSMKNALLPRIKKICLTTNYLSVRVNSLVCLGKLLEHLDKWLVLDEVLPILTQIPSKEPAVLMGILGIYKLAMDHKKLGLTKDIMATQIIPFLMPLTIENGLTLNQFNSLMSVVKYMVNKVEAEHKTKLEQLNSIKHEQMSTLDMTKVSNTKPNEIIPNMNPEKISSMDEMFQGLGLGSYLERKSHNSSLSSGNSSPIPSQKLGESLSMDEKQRLARDQEFQQRLKDQSPMLTPTPSAIPKTRSSTKDLTSTLINSSLSSLNLSNESVARAPMNMSFSQTIPNNTFIPVSGTFNAFPNQSLNVGMCRFPVANPQIPQWNGTQNVRAFSQTNSIPNTGAFDNLVSLSWNSNPKTLNSSSNASFQRPASLNTNPINSDAKLMVLKPVKLNSTTANSNNPQEMSYKDLEDLLS